MINVSIKCIFKHIKYLNAIPPVAPHPAVVFVLRERGLKLIIFMYDDNNLYSGSQLEMTNRIAAQHFYATQYHFHGKFLGHMNMNK